jgi:hypothetical protein
VTTPHDCGSKSSALHGAGRDMCSTVDSTLLNQVAVLFVSNVQGLSTMCIHAMDDRYEVKRKCK